MCQALPVLPSGRSRLDHGYTELLTPFQTHKQVLRGGGDNPVCHWGLIPGLTAQNEGTVQAKSKVLSEAAQDSLPVSQAAAGLWELPSIQAVIRS